MNKQQRERVDEWLTDGYGYSLAGVTWLEDRQTDYQHLQIGRHADFGHFLRLDGAFQCSESDEFFYHEPLVHTALLAARQPRRVLIMGGGDGGAAEEALKWPALRQLDHVEIDAEVVRACREPLRSVHLGVLDGVDARHRLLIADGADWLRQPEQRGAYDAIVLDLTDPGGPSAALHDEVFYSHCRDALAPGGVLTLHIASPWAHLSRCVQRVACLRQVFAAVHPFEVQVPMSGGSWLMALCTAQVGRAVFEQPQGLLQARLDALRGPALQRLSAGTFLRQFALPPYLARQLQPA